jgi:hypothetical protein
MIIAEHGGDRADWECDLVTRDGFYGRHYKAPCLLSGRHFMILMSHLASHLGKNPALRIPNNARKFKVWMGEALGIRVGVGTARAFMRRMEQRGFIKVYHYWHRGPNGPTSRNIHNIIEQTDRLYDFVMTGVY